MKHRKKKSRLNRNASHRRALVKNLTISFFTYDKIKTTHSKAKMIQPILERIITLGKTDSLAVRRNIIKKIGSNKIASKIIKDISPKYKNRKGGYTRIIKIGTRKGDNATEVHIKLV